MSLFRSGSGTSAVMAMAVAVTMGVIAPAGAQTAPRPQVHNVVLVHGAWADGSSWSKVIPLLEAKGLNVTAAQNPLTSLAEDVATTRRLIAKQMGPTILVGHSYSGFVITEAGNAPDVTGWSTYRRMDPPKVRRITI